MNTYSKRGVADRLKGKIFESLTIYSPNQESMKPVYTFLICVACLLFPRLLTAQVAIFVKVTATPVVEGESLDVHHLNELEALAFTQSATACTNGTCVTSGPFIINAHPDKSINAFRKAAYSNSHFQRIDITFRKPGANPFEYEKITLMDVLITGVTEVLGEADAATTVQIMIQPVKIGWTFFHKTSAGVPISDKYGFDLSTRAEWTGF